MPPYEILNRSGTAHLPLGPDPDLPIIRNTRCDPAPGLPWPPKDLARTTDASPHFYTALASRPCLRAGDRDRLPVQLMASIGQYTPTPRPDPRYHGTLRPKPTGLLLVSAAKCAAIMHSGNPTTCPREQCETGGERWRTWKATTSGPWYPSVSDRSRARSRAGSGPWQPALPG